VLGHEPYFSIKGGMSQWQLEVTKGGRVEKPRLWRKGKGVGGEVDIPVYVARLAELAETTEVDPKSELA